ncbi:MAG: glycosyltransferase [Chitinivibrionia bacterium]|nr:glycosyltransferase [Chitinivibrionia bacterium]
MQDTMRNPAPVVSAIIPCFNGERFIGRAIESVLGQSFERLEAIVVDDGSTDSSASIIRRERACRRAPACRLISTRCPGSACFSRSISIISSRSVRRWCGGNVSMRWGRSTNESEEARTIMNSASVYSRSTRLDTSTRR